MMSKKEFWIRLPIYILFGGALPFAFLIWRFKLFSKVSKLSIGGWGIIAVIFISVFFIKLIKAVRKGLPFSLVSQILEGVCKIIIPLLVGAFCCYYLKDMMEEVFQFLWVLIICESIAIVVNPIPKWAHENKNDSLIENLKALGLNLDKKEK